MTKFCKNCVHFRPMRGLLISQADADYYGKCDLVRDIVSGAPTSARLERETGKCGSRGNNFEGWPPV